MASGDSLSKWGARACGLPSSNFATPDTRNSHDVLDFDAGTDESALFTGVLDPAYDGGGVTVYLTWMASSATSGNCVWGAAFERIAANSHDLDSDSFATANTATGAADGTSGEVTVTTIAFTSGAQMDSVAAGELFRLKVYRDADNGSDTMTGDAELLFVEIRET